ncbi:Thimet oligopeptidase [Lecanicillium sp. MT-2017a]|nr:Thimet oligopeptidase [Lecanicillium sp. MT-2017a]
MAPRPLPRVFAASEIEAEIAAVIAKVHGLQNDLVATVTPSTASFANVFTPWIEVLNEVEATTSMVLLLSHAVQDPETRSAATKANNAYVSAFAAWMARADVFHLFKTAAGRDEDLDPESRLWVEEELRDFAAHGHESLQGTELDTFISQRSKIEELKIAYGRNLREEGGGVAMTREELAGVSEEIFAEVEARE